MKNFKCQLSLLLTLTLSLCLGISSFAQWAGDVDTTFVPNNGGVPYLTDGYYGASGVEIIDNSVYYGFKATTGYPKIRKYDFQGNEDQNYLNNQMSSWGGQFATLYLETEKDQNGIPTGGFYISGRNSFNWGVNQGVRFLNKINPDGTRDIDFVCPYTSWISMCSAIYHDWENNKLYYSFQSGWSESSYFQTIVCCDPLSGQVLQTIQLPAPTGLITKIIKIPGTNELICGGSFNFNYGGHNYNGVFKLDEQMNITPIIGITDLSSSMAIYDILFVEGSECDGIGSNLVAYFCGSIGQASGVSGFRNLVRYKINSSNWIVDSQFNAGTPGAILDICFYNCTLIATGNFASSSPSQIYQPTWTPKVTGFTTDGQISEDFKTTNIGAGLGGINLSGFENSYGQGTGRCLAVNSYDDGNDYWEIFVGGTFINWIQLLPPRAVLRSQNFMAKLQGFKNSIDANFDYCIDNVSKDKYKLSAFEVTSTNGCEKWELYLSEELPFSWNLIRVENTHDFTDDNLIVKKWYKLVRTITECGNSSSTSYIVFKDAERNQPLTSQVELRNSTVSNKVSDNKSSSEAVDFELDIFPNPSDGQITISDRFTDMYRNVSVYNTIGSKMLSLQFSSNIYKMDLTDLPAGVYMIVVTTESGVKKQQIIKQ